MAGQISQTITNGNDVSGNAAPPDPWAAAFAALEQRDEKDSEASAAAGEDRGDQGSQGSQAELGAAVAEGADQGAEPVGDGAPDGAVTEEPAGGSGDDAGVGGVQDGGAASDDGLGFSAEELDSYRDALVEDIANRTTQYVNKAFLDQGVMGHDGIVGATIDDPRICKRDRDGVPHFFNPETGREFTGDNPRAQAQAFVDSYNKELEEKFNQACSQYSQRLASEEAVGLAVLEFAPKYEKMDPVKQGMFDVLVSQFEVKDDSGEVVGYDVDLDSVAARVDQLVETIQSFAPKNEEPQGETVVNSTPALDMKNSVAVAQQQNREPQSVEDALLMIQNQMLESRK